MAILCLQVSRFNGGTFAHSTKLLHEAEASSVIPTEAIMALSLADFKCGDVWVQSNDESLHCNVTSN